MLPQQEASDSRELVEVGSVGIFLVLRAGIVIVVLLVSLLSLMLGVSKKEARFLKSPRKVAVLLQ